MSDSEIYRTYAPCEFGIIEEECLCAECIQFIDEKYNDIKDAIENPFEEI